MAWYDIVKPRWKPLSEVSDSVGQFQKRWNEKFDTLDDVLEEMKTMTRKSGKRK